MCKIGSISVNGIEFIQISRLPIRQAQRLMEWLPKSSVRKLTVAGKVVEDCIPYVEYESWYDFSFRTSKKINFELYL